MAEVILIIVVIWALLVALIGAFMSAATLLNGKYDQKEGKNKDDEEGDDDEV